jgi:hypothetical protein
VGGHHHGGARAVDPIEQPHDPLAGGRVQVAGGLVGQQQQRSVDEGPGHGHPLLLPPGQLPGEVVALLRQPDQVQHLGHLRLDDVPGSTDHLERERHVLEHRLVREQAEVLEDTADVAPQVGDAPRAQVGDLATGHPDAPLIRRLFAQQQAQHGGLARPRRTDQEHELALVDVEGHPPQSGGADLAACLVRLGDVLKADHGNGGPRRSLPTTLGRQPHGRLRKP